MTTARFIIVLAAVTFVSAAAAQDHRPSRVIAVPATVIQGHRQVPLAIVLTRSRVDFSPPELQTSFVREIVRGATH